MSDLAQLDQKIVAVTAQDLPLHCPQPAVKLWDTPPRVFLDVARTGHAQCPYCGTRYELKGDAPRGGH